MTAATARKPEPPATSETDEAVQIQPLRDSMRQLEALYQRTRDAREAYADLVEAVADNTRLKPAVIRAYVNARMSEARERKAETAKQLALVFEEVGV